MATHPFLSDDWFAVVDRLVEELGPEAPAGADVVLNFVVTDTPFGAERHLHVGARGGRAHWGIGHAADGDLVVTTDYATARDILLSGESQMALGAFMAGKVKVQGDLSKVLALQVDGAPVGAFALAEAIQGVTA